MKDLNQDTCMEKIRTRARDGNLLVSFMDAFREGMRSHQDQDNDGRSLVEKYSREDVLRIIDASLRGRHVTFGWTSMVDVFFRWTEVDLNYDGYYHRLGRMNADFINYQSPTKNQIRILRLMRRAVEESDVWDA